MDLTHKDVREILSIIDGAEHLNEIELVMGGFRLHVVRNGVGGSVAARMPAAAEPAASPQAPPAAASAPSARPVASSTADTPPAGVIAIRAPMLGTFYRAPAPNERPFVEIGQRVKADDTVCMIEVMKLFNSIRAGVDGVVIKICVENAGMVEFDQPLIHIKPD